MGIFSRIKAIFSRIEAKKLVSTIVHGDEDAGRKAYIEISVFKDEYTVDLLIEILSGKWNLRIAQNSVVKDLPAPQQAKYYAACALGKIGNTRAIKPIVESMSHSGLEYVKDITDPLHDFGEPGVSILLKILNDTSYDGEVRRWVARAIGKIGSKQAIDPFIKILRNKQENRWVRLGVVEAIKYYREASFIPPMKVILTDDTEWETLRDGSKEALDWLKKNGVHYVF